MLCPTCCEPVDERSLRCGAGQFSVESGGVLRLFDQGFDLVVLNRCIRFFEDPAAMAS